ncbi:hypothetical protein [Bradyrhizobium sp. I1.7.5]|uniref:hypothetical protein n=1 Tax=Bradyrhizobium sp. I1.7.5 TaxID=3156363 RepID=UPI003391E364
MASPQHGADARDNAVNAAADRLDHLVVRVVPVDYSAINTLAKAYDLFVVADSTKKADNSVKRGSHLGELR